MSQSHSVSSLSLSDGITSPRSLHSSPSATHPNRSMTSAPPADAVGQATHSIKAQVAVLGQKLGDFYRRADGQGIAPSLASYSPTTTTRQEAGHSGHSIHSTYSTGALGGPRVRLYEASAITRPGSAAAYNYPPGAPQIALPSLGSPDSSRYFGSPLPLPQARTSASMYSLGRAHSNVSAREPPPSHSTAIPTYVPGMYSRPSLLVLPTYVGAAAASPNYMGPSSGTAAGLAPRSASAHSRAPSNLASAGGPYGRAPHHGGGSGSFGHVAAAPTPAARDWHMAAAPAHNTSRSSYRPRGGSASANGMDVSAVVASKEEERLRELLQEMRHDRRRLEDRLLSGDSQGSRVQDLRDELEKQVAVLSRQRDALEFDTGGMATAQQTAGMAEADAERLHLALGEEQHTVAQLMGLRDEVEGKLVELGGAVDMLSGEHHQVESALTQERDKAVLKLKKTAKALALCEQQMHSFEVENESLRRELQAREVSLAEVKASAEVLQYASSHVQSQLGGSNKELEARCADLTHQLEESKSQAGHASSTAAAAQHASQEATAQVKESLMRTDFLRTEREKLLKVLQVEQTAAAATRLELERANAQIQAENAARMHAEAVGRNQADVLQREHDLRISGLTTQFEAQLASAERAAASAHRQYDNSVHSGEQLQEVHGGLRKERDALWSDFEDARAELLATQRERDDLANRVAVLRAEVKATMDDVMVDRDARLAAANQMHKDVILQMQAQCEARLAGQSHEHEARVAGLMELCDRVKVEALEAVRSADRHKASVTHLKEQLREVLVAKDDLARELVQERAYAEELSKLVAQVKASQRELPRG